MKSVFPIMSQILILTFMNSIFIECRLKSLSKFDKFNHVHHQSRSKSNLNFFYENLYLKKNENFKI